MSAMGAVYGRAKVADRVPPIANVAISNVPGPAFPLYLSGAKMLANYPASIVVHGIALNITVQSYNESLDFGMMACGKAMPDVADFARDVADTYAELKALPPTAAAAAAPAPTEKARSPAGRKAPGRVAKATRTVRASEPS
jgi:hypothetical protein